MDIKDLNFSDVAGFYINCDPPVKSRYDGNEVFLVEVRQNQVLWQFVDENLQSFPIDEELVPCFRAVEDMTEAEIKEWLAKWPQEAIGSDSFPLSFHFDPQWIGQEGCVIERNEYGVLVKYPWFTHLQSGFFATAGIYKECYSPDQFHWLISKRVDVFGLILNNKAVREGGFHE